MAIERNDVDERQARLDVIIGEFRAARQRLLVKQATALWNRSEAHRRAAAKVELPPAKIN